MLHGKYHNEYYHRAFSLVKAGFVKRSRNRHIFLAKPCDGRICGPAAMDIGGGKRNAFH